MSLPITPPTPVGRFAPSPSGPLHQGSLVAAIGSYLSAKSRGGRWLLRMEDVDTPRVRPGAADAICRQLESLGLEWDGPIVWQSARTPAYAAALEHLRTLGLVYGCACTRQQLARRSCPCLDDPPANPRAWRLRITEQSFPLWEDRLLGPQTTATPPSTGPILRRADGIFAYLLAAVVDDAAQGVTEVIRGDDLRPLTPLQAQLQRALGVSSPTWGHLPLVRDAQGRKLSKSHGAEPWTADPGLAWELTLGHLGYPQPPELHGAPAPVWREWALLRNFL